MRTLLHMTRLPIVVVGRPLILHILCAECLKFSLLQLKPAPVLQTAASTCFAKACIS